MSYSPSATNRWNVDQGQLQSFPRLGIPLSLLFQLLFLAERFQLRQVLRWRYLQIPADLAQAHRAEVERLAVAFGEAVGTVHVAGECRAMLYGEDVPRLVAGRRKSSPEALLECRISL